MTATTSTSTTSTSTTSTAPTRAAGAATSTGPTRAAGASARVRRANRFALWGVPAGVLGFLAMGTAPRVPWEPGRTTTVADLEALVGGGFHRSIVLGLAATFCLAVLTAGWRRWAETRVPDSLAGRLLSTGLTASVGAMLLGYGFYGSLAVYLPGGMDQGAYDLDGLYAVYLFLDFAPFIAWWGVTFAAIAVAVLALKERALPRWLGVLTIPFVLAPIAFVSVAGLPGFPGVVSPLWLVLTGVGLALRRRDA